MSQLVEFFNNNLAARIIFDAYFALFLISLILFICFKYRKALNLTIIGLALSLIYFLSTKFNFELSKTLYGPFVDCYIIIVVII